MSDDRNPSAGDAASAHQDQDLSVQAHPENHSEGGQDPAVVQQDEPMGEQDDGEGEGGHYQDEGEGEDARDDDAAEAEPEGEPEQDVDEGAYGEGSSNAPPSRTPAEKARDRQLHQYMHQTMTGLAKARDLAVEENTWLNAALAGMREMVDSGEWNSILEEERAIESQATTQSEENDPAVVPGDHAAASLAAPTSKDLGEKIRTKMEEEVDHLRKYLDTAEQSADSAYASQRHEDSTSSLEVDAADDLEQQVLFTVIAKLQKDKADLQVQKDALRTGMREVMSNISDAQDERIALAREIEGRRAPSQSEVHTSVPNGETAGSEQFPPPVAGSEGVDAIASQREASLQVNHEIHPISATDQNDHESEYPVAEQEDVKMRDVTPALTTVGVKDEDDTVRKPPGRRPGSYAYHTLPELPEYDEMEKMLRDIRGYIDLVIKFYSQTGQFPPPGIYQNPHYPEVNAPYIPEKIFPKRIGRPPRITLGHKALPQQLQKLLSKAFRRGADQASLPKKTVSPVPLQVIRVANDTSRSRRESLPKVTEEENVDMTESRTRRTRARRFRQPRVLEEESRPSKRRRAGEDGAAGVSVKRKRKARDGADDSGNEDAGVSEPARPGRKRKTQESAGATIVLGAEGPDMNAVTFFDESDPSLSTQVPYQLQFQERLQASSLSSQAALRTIEDQEDESARDPTDEYATSRMVHDLINKVGTSRQTMDNGYLNGVMDARAWGFEPTPIDLCQNCGRRETSAWRKINVNGIDYRLCNACGLHYQKNGVMRPPSAWGDINAHPRRRGRPSERVGGERADGVDLDSDHEDVRDDGHDIVQETDLGLDQDGNLHDEHGHVDSQGLDVSTHGPEDVHTQYMHEEEQVDDQAAYASFDPSQNYLTETAGVNAYGVPAGAYVQYDEQNGF